jgi:hypothetical protein
MKTRFKSSFPTLILSLLCCGCFISSLFSQGGGLWVYPNSQGAYPINEVSFSPESATQNVTLNGLFAEYGVYYYHLSFPGSITPSLQNAYSIGLTGDPYALKDSLESLGLFDLIEIQTNYIENDIESSQNLVNGCPNPWTPNDPGAGNWANELIEVECAWSIEQGSPNIVAAVVDRYFELTHPDLANKIVALVGPNNIPASNPLLDHGTGMSGAIAAEPNNNYCVAGVGYNTRFAAYSLGNMGIWELIWQAYQDGRPVINVSFGPITYPGNPPVGMPQTEIDAAIEVVNGGTTLVVSSGVPDRDGTHNDIAPIHGVIKTSLIDENENFPLSIPNGPEWEERDPDVDISAPGANGLQRLRVQGSCGPNILGGGTSIAAAHVTGTVALLLSANPCLTPAEIEGIIKATAKPVLNGDDPQDPFYGRVGAGYINVYHAVRMAKGDPDPIIGNKRWDYPVYVDGTLVIEGGGSLTISSQVRFGPNGKIVVKRGGELYVDGGHLANGCEDRWEGIIVEGNKNTFQAIGLVSGKRDQGYVELHNAIIENAVYGVRLYDPAATNPVNTSGGVIRAYGTRFINNIIGVDFAPYQNYSELYGHKLGNLSTFYSCTFLADPAFPGDFDNFITHVSLKRVTGIEFYGCIFKNGIEHEEYAYADEAKTALTAWDADFLVTRRCYGPLPCSNPERSRFEGFATAISASNKSTLNTFRVSYTDFSDNYTGISATKVDNPYMVKNTFEVGMDIPGLNNPFSGIQLIRCTGFKVEENHFDPFPNAYGGKETIGIVTIFSGDQPNEIYKNNFDGLDFGNLSNGDNRGASENEGLVFYCNINGNNQYDFAVPDESVATWGIAEYQGLLDKAAANSFTSNPPNAETHFLNHAAPIVYFFSPGGGPQNYTGNGKITFNGNAESNGCSSQLPNDDQTTKLTATEKTTYRGGFFTGTDASEKFYAANMLIRDFLINDSIQSLDSVRTWLAHKGDLFSYFAIVDSWLQESQPDSAAQVLTAIPNLFFLTDEYLSEYNYFDSLKTIQIGAQQTGKEDDDVVLDNLSDIQRFAEAGNYLASVQAQSMVNSVLGPTYAQKIILPEVSQSRLFLPENSNELAGKDRKAPANVSLTAVPNPANETTAIFYKLPEGERTGKLKIFTFNGQLTEENEISSNSGKIVINTANLPNGVYFCTLMSASKEWMTLKLVIAR